MTDFGQVDRASCPDVGRWRMAIRERPRPLHPSERFQSIFRSRCMVVTYNLHGWKGQSLPEIGA